ncbi:MAG: hypothetical protein IH870_04835 [Chloroflexi bacterium]|nr:hypothetical protein [Chloroflexota bacterium]
MKTRVLTGVLALTILAAFLAGFHSSQGSPQPVGAQISLNQETVNQQTVTLAGQVVNRTDGATLEPGLRVTLHSFSQTSGVFLSQDAATDESGSFLFPDVELLQEGGYAVTTDYADTRYSTLFRPEDLDEPVELVVYETTQDISVIRVVHQALILTEVDPSKQMITAAIFVNLSNESDRTLLPDLTNVGPGRFSFLRFSLPPQAEELDVQSDLVGGQIIPTGSGFAMTAPVNPGEHNISYSFRFPYQGNALSYKQSLLQGADVFQVLIPQRLSEIQVETLEPMPPLNAAGASYLVWERAELAPGQGVEIELANLPRSNLLSRWGRAATDASFWQIALPSAMGAVLAGLLIYGGVLRLPRALAGDAAVPGRASSEPTPPGRARLIGEIAALDDGFQKGGIDPATYASRRAELKALVLNPGADQSNQQDNPEAATETTSPGITSGGPDR